MTQINSKVKRRSGENCQAMFSCPRPPSVVGRKILGGSTGCSASQLNIRKMGSRDGAVVRALASHQCVPGSIPGPGVIFGLSLLLVLVLAPRVFLRVLRFSSLPKNQHFQIPIRSEIRGPQVCHIRTVMCYPR